MIVSNIKNTNFYLLLSKKAGDSISFAGKKDLTMIFWHLWSTKGLYQDNKVSNGTFISRKFDDSKLHTRFLDFQKIKTENNPKYFLHFGPSQRVRLAYKLGEIKACSTIVTDLYRNDSEFIQNLQSSNRQIESNKKKLVSQKNW